MNFGQYFMRVMHELCANMGFIPDEVIHELDTDGEVPQSILNSYQNNESVDVATMNVHDIMVRFLDPE